MTVPYLLTRDPPNAGVPVGEQTGRPLSQAEMYQRNNFSIPPDPPSGFELNIGGGSRFIDVATLAALPQHTVTMVLECAGNGRTLMDPVPEGTPWDLGGASTIVARGARLCDLVGKVPEDSVELVFTGADHGAVEPDGPIPYQFSIDAALAAGELPLLATHIGDEPLTVEHGAPVRLLVPGQYAMKSVKWLTRIHDVTEPHRGHFVERYRYFDDESRAEGEPVADIAVRSIITTPGEGQIVSAGELQMAGSAWSSGADVERVEVSTDGGRSWMEAAVQPGPGPFAPSRWRAAATVPEGSWTIMARATDTNGDSQPLHPVWNRNGYANNVVHQVEIVARSG